MITGTGFLRWTKQEKRDGAAARARPVPRARLAHRHLEDRFRATLRPRRELYEAIFAYALHMSRRRRRRAGTKRAPINRVAERGGIWFQANRQKVIERYQAHLDYLEKDHPIAPSTLYRHVAAFRREKLLLVGNYSRFDKRRGEWVQVPNIYTITEAGILWIKLHARALKVPLVV